MYEQNVLSGHNKVIQAHVQSRATGIEDKGHHVLRAVVGARPDLRIAPTPLSRVHVMHASTFVSSNVL